MKCKFCDNEAIDEFYNWDTDEFDIPMCKNCFFEYEYGVESNREDIDD